MPPVAAPNLLAPVLGMPLPLPLKVRLQGLPRYGPAAERLAGFLIHLEPTWGTERAVQWYF